jgi:hypothetical protein
VDSPRNAHCLYDLKMPEIMWYVAYGANTHIPYFLTSFEGTDLAIPAYRGHTWATLPHQLYFASRSQKWQGSAVAFVSLEKTSDYGAIGRAYLVDLPGLKVVLRAEHGGIPPRGPLPDFSSTEPGQWCELPTSAKYNAILRLSDINQIPAYTITTARFFESGRPTDPYLCMCRQGLQGHPCFAKRGCQDTGICPAKNIDAYLENAIVRPRGEGGSA